MKEQTQEWDLIICPKRRLFDIPIRELIRYRDLIILFIKRDFTTQYKQTILGPLWFIITPLISTIMYSFVFGNLAKLSTDGVPHLLFYYSGTMLWTFFSGCFSDASNIFVNNASIFSKVYFPRLTVPISNVALNVLRTGLQFIFLMSFFVYYLLTTDNLKPSPYALAFPLLLLWIAAMATGAGMLISAITTKYKDIRLIMSYLLSLAMYATPVVYPLSEIPKRFQWLAYANPMVAPIEVFRLWFYGVGNIRTTMIFSSILITIFILIFGVLIFNRNEQNFVDVI